MEPRRVIEAQYPVGHAALLGVGCEHRRAMPAGLLHPSVIQQFWEEAKNNAAHVKAPLPARFRVLQRCLEHLLQLPGYDLGMMPVQV